MLLTRAANTGYKDRTAYLIAIAAGTEPRPVEVVVEKVVEVPVAVEKPRLPFEDAWAKLSKCQQNQLAGYPGSKAAAKALYEME